MPTREEIERWLKGFDEVHRVELEELRREGPRPGASDLALSMIHLVERAGLRRPDNALDPESERIRQTWARLRAARR
jgi:hypothetical protein